MKHVYVDMDGVVSDFRTTFELLMRLHKESNNWKFFSRMVREENLFGRLNMTTNGNYLMNWLKVANSNNTFRITFLSSGADSSGKAHFEDAYRQKRDWLTLRGMNYPLILVQQKSMKKMYANENAFLIDDTESNVKDFIAAGGKAVLHVDSDIETTIKALKEFLETEPAEA